MVKTAKDGENIFVHDRGVWFHLGTKEEVKYLVQELFSLVYDDDEATLTVKTKNITKEERKNCKYHDELYGCNGCHRIERKCILKK